MSAKRKPDSHLKFPSGRSVRRLREDAKALARERGIPVPKALDELAAKNGIAKPWDEALRMLTQAAPVIQIQPAAGGSNAGGYGLVLGHAKGFFRSKPVIATADELCRHTLLVAPTGYGHTTYLEGLFVQAVKQGMPTIFVDDLPSNHMPMVIKDYPKGGGQERPLVIDLSPAETGKPAPASDSFNPFAAGTTEEMLNALIGWQRPRPEQKTSLERAKVMLRAALGVLVEERDRSGRQLSAEVLRASIGTLDNLEMLLDSAVPGGAAHDRLLEYLAGLPGWTTSVLRSRDDEGLAARQMAEEQHAYQRAHISDLLDHLCCQCAHAISSAPSFNLEDAIAARRTIYIRLSDMPGHGNRTDVAKFMFACLYQALVKAMGRWDSTDTYPDSAAVKTLAPYLIILGGYGRYAIDGFARDMRRARRYRLALMYGARGVAELHERSQQEGAMVLANIWRTLAMGWDDRGRPGNNEAPPGWHLLASKRWMELPDNEPGLMVTAQDGKTLAFTAAFPDRTS